MMVTPLVCAAVLARQWRWAELATIVAAIAALAAKDPLVVLARQRFVWKQRREETTATTQWFVGWLVVLILCGLVLASTWPWRALLALGLGAAAFTTLAVAVNVKNRQRSTLFQIVSAAALTASSLAACESATGSIAPWCWWLWLLLALQAAAGILVVHARLDARIAARGKAPDGETYRRAAWIAVIVLGCSAVAAAFFGRVWIALALLLAATGYSYDLREQRDFTALQLPLTKVGQRALALSTAYAILLIAGLWAG